MKLESFVQRTDHMARHNLLKFLFYSCNQLCVYTSFVHSKSWYITVKVLIPLRLALRGRDVALNQPILPFKSQKINSNIKKYPLFLFSTDFVTISLQLLMFCQILKYGDIQHIFFVICPNRWAKQKQNHNNNISYFVRISTLCDYKSFWQALTGNKVKPQISYKPWSNNFILPWCAKI